MQGRKHAKCPLSQSAPFLAPSLKLRPPKAVAPPLEKTYSVPSVLAGTPSARCLQDSPSPVPEISELCRSLPGHPRRAERRQRRLPRGAGPAPSAGLAAAAAAPPHPPHPRHRLPRGLEFQIPVPPSFFLSPRLPGAATVAGLRIPASQLVPASSPSSPQINTPPHASGARTAPFLPRPSVL